MVLFKSFFLVLALYLPGYMAQVTNQPCDLDDKECMRDLFGSKAACDTRVFRRIPTILSWQDLRYEAPYFNVSQIDQQLNIRNVGNCTVKAFYRDDNARALVMGIECPYIRMEAETAIILHFLGRADQVRYVKVIAEYDLIRLTLIFHGDSLDLCRETAHAWVTRPTLFFQGRDSQSVQFTRNDPRKMLSSNIWIEEIKISWATELFYAWFTYLICDFNCKNARYQ